MTSRRRKCYGRPFVSIGNFVITLLEMYSPAGLWTASPSVSFPVDMPPKDPCQKQACAIQQCLQGIHGTASRTLHVVMLSGYNSLPRLQPTNTWRACVRTWSGRWGGAARRKPENPSAVLGSRTRNPRRTRVAHSLPWDGGNTVLTYTNITYGGTVEKYNSLRYNFFKMTIHERGHVVTKRPWYNYTFRVVLLQPTCNYCATAAT